MVRSGAVGARVWPFGSHQNDALHELHFDDRPKSRARPTAGTQMTTTRQIRPLHSGPIARHLPLDAR